MTIEPLSVISAIDLMISISSVSSSELVCPAGFPLTIPQRPCLNTLLPSRNAIAVVQLYPLNPYGPDVLTYFFTPSSLPVSHLRFSFARRIGVIYRNEERMYACVEEGSRVGLASNLYVFSSHLPGPVLSGVSRFRVSFVLLATSTFVVRF